MAEELAHQIKPITQETAIKDYERFCKNSCDKINPRSRVGNNALDFLFFPHRLMTKGKKGKNINFIEWLETSYKTKPHVQRLVEYAIKGGRSEIKALYAAYSLYFKSINSFNPNVARKLYYEYKPTTILDFSAGWGGRCLAAMSLDINYIGFDTNVSLQSAYKSLVDLYPTKSEIRILFEDSSKVDYSLYKYDMVFTSPPYYTKHMLETYENMPSYVSKEDFNTRFFYPVVKNTFNHLMPGGIYALNIPTEMYDDIKTILGEASIITPLIFSYRNTGQYKEYIYIWKKNC
jgi:hypothetical protein